MIENKHKITLTLAPDDDFRYSEALVPSVRTSCSPDPA